MYYRINVIELKLPTLNARRDDIPVLAKHFLALIADEWQLETPPTLTDDACARLQHHDFAGNVRELRNVLERAITLAETSTIDASHLGLPDLDLPNLDNRQEITTSASQNISASTATTSTVSHLDKKDNVVAETIKDNSIKDHLEIDSTQQSKANIHPYRTATQHYPSMTARAVTSVIEETTKPMANALPESLSNQNKEQQALNKPVSTKDMATGQLPAQGLEHYLQEQERRLIITALKQTGWNKTQAAELLGTTFRSLRYRMTKLEIAEDQAE